MPNTNLLPSFIKTKKSEDDWKNSEIEEMRKNLLKRVSNNIPLPSSTLSGVIEFRNSVFNDPDSIHGPNSTIGGQEE